VQHWHALFTKPRMEFRVAGLLETRGMEVFAPALEYHGKTGNLLEKPFFPRYIFARFDWEGEGITNIQWTPGLTRVLTFEGRPAWLADDEIEFLYRRLVKLDGDEFVRLKPGEHVRITDGAFRDFEAIFHRHLNGRERVAVLLDIMGRKTRVVLRVDEVERTA